MDMLDRFMKFMNNTPEDASKMAEANYQFELRQRAELSNTLNKLK